MFKVRNKKEPKGQLWFKWWGIHQNVVTMDEMTMAQCIIIQSNDTMVATDFQ